MTLIVTKYTSGVLCVASDYFFAAHFLRVSGHLFSHSLSLSLSLSLLCVYVFVCMCVAPARVSVHADCVFLPNMFVKFHQTIFLELLVFVDATILQSWYLYSNNHVLLLRLCPLMGCACAKVVQY